MSKPGWIFTFLVILSTWGCGSAPESRLMGLWSNHVYIENQTADLFAFVDFATDGTMQLQVVDPEGIVSALAYEGTYEVLDETQLLVTAEGESRLWSYQLEGDELVLDVPGERPISMTL